MKVQSKFVLFSTTFILAIASNAVVVHSAHAGLFDSRETRIQNLKADLKGMSDDDTRTGKFARKRSRLLKLQIKDGQDIANSDLAGTNGKARVSVKTEVDVRESFPVYRDPKPDYPSRDQDKTTDQGTDHDSNGPLRGCKNPFWTDNGEWICRDEGRDGDCDHDKGTTDQGKTDQGKTDQGKTDQGKTDQGKTSCTDPNAVWNPATGYCEPKTVHCDLTKTEYNPRTNSCDPLPDNGCDDDETFVEGKGCVKDPLPPVKPTKPTKPVRPPNKKPNQGKIPPVKTKTIPTPVHKHKKKPTTPVVVAPCPDQTKLDEATKENERLKQEQIAKDRAQHDKDEANRIAQEAKEKAHAEEVARLKKKSEQDNVPMIGSAQLIVNNHFKQKGWDPNGETKFRIRKSEHMDVSVDNPTLGQSKGLAQIGNKVNTDFNKRISDFQRQFSIADDNNATADAARKAAKANGAN
jgi:hypothetical protein